MKTCEHTEVTNNFDKHYGHSWQKKSHKNVGKCNLRINQIMKKNQTEGQENSYLTQHDNIFY